MKCEIDNKLGYEKSKRISNDGEKEVSKNYRNGCSQKTIKSQLGEVWVKTPRDRYSVPFVKTQNQEI
jgi:putative transposase